MSLVRPFPARIVEPAVATAVVSPMHDALSPAARAALLADNPLTYLQVTRSALDLPDASDAEIGAANAASLERLLAAGAYGPQAAPALYVYRVHLGSELHTGIVCELDAAGFVDGRVLGHEAVQPDRVAALVRHFESVPTRSELVAVMHRADPVVAQVVHTTTSGTPLLSMTDSTGVEQAVWRIDDADSAVVVERLEPLRHYIADGHHRVAATVQRWREHGSPRGGAVLCVLYPEDQMHLLAFHRRVVGPVDAEQLRAALATDFDVVEVPVPQVHPGAFGLRLEGRWAVVRPRAKAGGGGAAALDVSVLDRALLRPLLGVGSGDERVVYVSERADLDDVVRSVDADGGALFLLAAPSLAELIDVAERGEVMPQKSTYIEPKPRSGVFLRPRQGPVDPRDLPPAG